MLKGLAETLLAANAEVVAVVPALYELLSRHLAMRGRAEVRLWI